MWEKEGGLGTRLNHVMYFNDSLIPRPFPPPVFDRFQYKNGGGRPGRKSHVGRCEGRREGGGARRRISRSYL